MFLFVCREEGHAFLSSLASPPRLQSHLCPSVSFGLTLTHSAWENCTTACRKGSHTHLSGSTALRNFVCFSAASRSFLLISHIESIHRHRSTASSDLCLPADNRQQSFRHVSLGELALNFPSINTRGWIRSCLGPLLAARFEHLIGTLLSNAAQLWQPHPSYHSYGLPMPSCQTRRRRCHVLQIVTTFDSG